MPKCQYAKDICGWDSLTESEPHLCILHSPDPAKDMGQFLHHAVNRSDKNCRFDHVVFPARACFGPGQNLRVNFDKVSFEGAVFLGEASFRNATFGQANFLNARFKGLADFNRTEFPNGADFSGAVFDENVDFSYSRFTGGLFREAMFRKSANFVSTTLDTADFREAMFRDRCTFEHGTFRVSANFQRAKFAENAWFSGCRFEGVVEFDESCFEGQARFEGATFSKTVSWWRAVLGAGAFFWGSSFDDGADFREVAFYVRADFGRSRFAGRTIFAARKDGTSVMPVFYGIEVDLREVNLEQSDVVILRNADLNKCRLLDTDVSKVEFIGVTWPDIGGRNEVYDEVALEPNEGALDRIEQLYRNLKQNYEDRKDYERAGDFHYGEKEMRRLNPKTRRGLRCFLWLYWLLSGYGERYFRPAVWAALLLVLGAGAYLWLGLTPKTGGAALSYGDWLWAAHYSLRVMTFLRPDDLVPSRNAAFVHTAQSLLGPVFLGLFALALRQRLKR